MSLQQANTLVQHDMSLSQEAEQFLNAAFQPGVMPLQSCQNKARDLARVLEALNKTFTLEACCRYEACVVTGQGHCSGQA